MSVPALDSLSPEQLLDGGVGEPARIWLRAGALTCACEDGMIRAIRWGRHEIVRGIYAAVRDHDWGTVTGAVRDLQIEQGEDGFTVSFTSDHRIGDDIAYRWHGRIEAAVGRLTFSFAGEALRAFQRNRIGFCILHPMEAAGASLTIEHVDGTHETSEFPRLIAPGQPFLDLRAVTHTAAPGLRCRVQMDGDTFEMEDQRNWTDASFKTYCTPLALPFPVQVNVGDRVRQMITTEVLRDEEFQDDGDPYEPTSTAPVTLRLTDSTTPIPDVGTEWQPGLSEDERRRLDALGLTHLRAEVRMRQPDALDRLDMALNDGAGVIALLLSDDYERELEAVRAWAEKREPPFLSWLILRDGEHAIPPEWVMRALELLDEYGEVGSGTDAEFPELNRHRPLGLPLEQVTYSVNPQVHVFDSASLMENALAQGETVRSARAFSGNAPIFVGPVTFKRRWNPVATSPDAAAVAVEARTDPRQGSLFGAAWTLASLVSLCAAEAESITYFQATGILGIVADHAVSPLAHVLADVCAMNDDDFSGQVRLIASDAPLRVSGLCLEVANRQRILLANLTRREQTAQLSGITGAYRARVLSLETAHQAMHAPEAFRARGAPMLLGGDNSIVLPPYAVVTLDRIDGTGIRGITMMDGAKTRIALMGAGGKMGSRITDNMKAFPEYELLYVEVSPQGIANLAQRGATPTPRDEALEQADAVILAVPDRLIGRIAQEIIELVQPGTMMIGLDPAAAYAEVMPIRPDLTYFISHPCHPPLFNDEVTEAGRTDWFGGVTARQHIVCALYGGPEDDYARGEAIARAMYAPVMNAYRVTVEQMAILEPALVETFSATVITAIKEALDIAIGMGVPEEAAREFLFGHIRIELAIIFGFAGFPFSDGAKLAIQNAYPNIFLPDWKERIMDLGALKRSVAEITDSLK